jgi:hypothetical protein
MVLEQTQCIIASVSNAELISQNRVFLKKFLVGQLVKKLLTFIFMNMTDFWDVAPCSLVERIFMKVDTEEFCQAVITFNFG